MTGHQTQQVLIIGLRQFIAPLMNIDISTEEEGCRAMAIHIQHPTILFCGIIPLPQLNVDCCLPQSQVNRLGS